jgi:hypothetical protein
LEVDQIIDFLVKKLQTLFQQIALHQFQLAEDSLEISNVIKSSFSIYENLTSPLLLFILSEKYYHEFQFTSSSSTSPSTPPPSHHSHHHPPHNRTTTLVNSYLQIISDIEIL